MTDIYQADDVEVIIAEHADGFRLWVNAVGENKLRIYRVRNLRLDWQSGTERLREGQTILLSSAADS